MAKFDRVDRLMEQAGRPPLRRAPSTEAEQVLEKQVSTSERGVPRATAGGPGQAPSSQAAPGSQEQETALGPAQPTPAARSRQILDALRPFLPVVGGALRMVDHGAVQAVARMLPALGVMGAIRGADAQPPSDGSALAVLDRRQAELAAELKQARQEFATYDEKLRRMRESLERAVAEQGTLTHRANQLEQRLRLLSAGLVAVAIAAVVALVLVSLQLRR